MNLKAMDIELFNSVETNRDYTDAQIINMFLATCDGSKYSFLAIPDGYCLLNRKIVNTAK